MWMESSRLAAGREMATHSMPDELGSSSHNKECQSMKILQAFPGRARGEARGRPGPTMLTQRGFVSP